MPSKLSVAASFGVDEAARRLKRFYYVERSLARITAGWLIQIPVWEIKLQMPYWIYQATENADALRARVIELRYPALDVDEDFDPPLTAYIEAAMNAPSWPEGLAAVQTLRSNLLQGYHHYLQMTLPVGDHPTIRLLRRMIAECSGQEQMISDLVSSLEAEEQRTFAERRRVLQSSLEYCGGLDGVAPPQPSASMPPAAAFQIPELPARDARFRSSVLRHTDAPETFEELRIYRFRTLMDEMSAVEVLCGCLVDAPQDLPWAFYNDLGRWIWDEGRHCEMGFEGIKRLGLDPFDPGYTNNFGSYAFSSRLPVVERIIVLSLLSETATIPFKIQCKEDYEQAADEVSAQVFDYDWADEAIHVTFGNRWAPVLLNQDTAALGERVQEVMQKWIDWGVEMGKDPDKNGTYGLFSYFQKGEWRL